MGTNTSKTSVSHSKKQAGSRNKTSHNVGPAHHQSEFDLDLVNAVIEGARDELDSLLDLRRQLRMRKEELEVAVETEWNAEQKLCEAEQNLQDAKQVTMHARNNMREAKAEFWERRGQITSSPTSGDQTLVDSGDNGIDEPRSQVRKRSSKRKADDGGSEKVSPRKKAKTAGSQKARIVAGRGKRLPIFGRVLDPIGRESR